MRRGERIIERETGRRGIVMAFHPSHAMVTVTWDDQAPGGWVTLSVTEIDYADVHDEDDAQARRVADAMIDLIRRRRPVGEVIG